MIRLILVALLSVVVARPAFAQTAPSRDDDHGRAKQYAGGALLVVGAVFGALANSAWAYDTQYCTATRIGTQTFSTCQTVKSPNWSVLSSGLGMTAAGAVLLIAGDREHKRHRAAPSVTFGPHHFGVVQRVTF